MELATVDVARVSPVAANQRAEATVTVRLWPDPPEIEAGRTIVVEGRPSTPTGRLWIGDADQNTVMERFPTSTAIRVVLQTDELDSPAQVWVDAWQA